MYFDYPILPLTDGVAYGETTQVQTVQGKNLIDLTALTYSTYPTTGGIVDVNTNNVSISYFGAYSIFYVQFYLPFSTIAGKTIYFKSESASTSTARRIALYGLNSSGNAATFLEADASSPFELSYTFPSVLPDGIYNYALLFYLRRSETTSTSITYSNIIMSETDIPYEPFVPNSPSPSYPSPLVNNIPAGTYRYESLGNRYLVTLPDMRSALTLKDAWNDGTYTKNIGLYKIPNTLTWNRATDASWSVQKRVLLSAVPLKKTGLNTLGLCTHFGIKNNGTASIGSNLLSVYSANGSVYWYPHISVFGLTGTEDNATGERVKFCVKSKARILMK